MCNKALKKSLMLFERLENNGIKHCHFKSNEHLLEGLSGVTDLDLLVEKDKSNEVQKVLLDLGYKRFESQPWVQYPGIEDWLGFDEKTGRTIHVHLHYQLLTGKRFVKEQHLPIEDIILDTSIKDSNFNIYITNPNLEIILLIIRIGFKFTFKYMLLNKKLPEDIQAELTYLYGLINKKEVERFAIKIFGAKYGSEIINIIESKKYDYRNIRKIKKIVKRTFITHRRYGKVLSIYKMFVGYFRLAKARLLKKLKLRTQSGKKLVSGGLIIAIIGCDGSGKSTVSNIISKWISWKVDTRKIYLGSGDGNKNIVINLIKKTWALFKILTRRKEVITLDKRIKEQKISKQSISKLISNSIFALILARYRFKQIVKAKYDSLNGSIIITDRYPQNEIVGFNDGPLLRNDRDTIINKIPKKIEEKYFKKFEETPPDIVIKLHISPEVGKRRKPDHPIENLRIKSQSIKEIKFKDAKEINIDANKPLEEVILEVKNSIWESL